MEILRVEHNCIVSYKLADGTWPTLAEMKFLAEIQSFPLSSSSVRYHFLDPSSSPISECQAALSVSFKY